MLITKHIIRNDAGNLYLFGLPAEDGITRVYLAGKGSTEVIGTVIAL